MRVDRIGLATNERALGRAQSFVGLRFEPKALTDYSPDGISKTPHESLVCWVLGLKAKSFIIVLLKRQMLHR